MNNIRKLNKQGLIVFADFLNANWEKGKKDKKQISDLEIPKHLLFDEEHSEELSVNKALKENNFTNRFDLGKFYYNYLHQSLTEEEERGQGLWAWLSLYHFEELYVGTLDRAEYYLPIGKKDEYQIIDPEKHLNFSTTNSLEYRHAVKGFYHFYRTFGDDAVILCAPSGMGFHGDPHEQIGGILWLKQYKIIMQAFKLLFWNSETKEFKKADGSTALATGPKQKTYLGGLRRARAVIDALMDIHNFEKIKKPIQLKNLMGDEFKAHNQGAGN